jgi:hypothetical protein
MRDDSARGTDMNSVQEPRPLPETTGVDQEARNKIGDLEKTVEKVLAELKERSPLTEAALRTDIHLAAIIKAWPTLPPKIRFAVAAIAESTKATK